MSGKYYQTFIVNTRFEFPIDMLRYDSAFPATEQDSGKISRSLTDHESPLEVTIGRFVDTKKSNPPTIERWQSFGCSISQIETR
jgi:hypothetical protein